MDQIISQTCQIANEYAALTGKRLNTLSPSDYAMFRRLAKEEIENGYISTGFPLTQNNSQPAYIQQAQITEEKPIETVTTTSIEVEKENIQKPIKSFGKSDTQRTHLRQANSTPVQKEVVAKTIPFEKTETKNDKEEAMSRFLDSLDI